MLLLLPTLSVETKHCLIYMDLKRGALLHLTRGAALEMRPDCPSVQLEKQGTLYYMPNTFHLAQTITPQNGDYIGEMVINNGGLPLLCLQISMMKPLAQVYFHNYKSYAYDNINLYINWPVKRVSVLGKVLDIIRPDPDSECNNFKRVDDVDVPYGKIKNNEYVLQIEDGSCSYGIAVRMSPSVYRLMEVSDMKFKVGSKVQISGLISQIRNHNNQPEIIALRAEIVGKPGDLFIETQWWRNCLKLKELLDSKWTMDRFKLAEEFNYERLLQLQMDESDQSDELALVHNDDEYDNLSACVTDLNCSFDDYLQDVLSDKIYMPNSHDIQTWILESLLRYSQTKEIISLNSIIMDGDVYPPLVQFLVSSMMECWSKLTNDTHLQALWEVTSFENELKKMVVNTLKEYPVELIKINNNEVELTVLNRILSIVDNKLNLSAVGESIKLEDVTVLIKRVAGLENTVIDELFAKSIFGNAIQNSISVWEKDFENQVWTKTYFQNNVIDLCEADDLGLHNTVIIPRIDLLKCLIFRVVLKRERLTLDSIINDTEIKVPLNKLVFSKINDTCGSIRNDIEGVINILKSSSEGFSFIKKKIIATIVLHFERCGVLSISYDGYLDRNTLVDYDFGTLYCIVNERLLSNFLIPDEQRFYTRKVRKSLLKNESIDINTALTNCLINYSAVRNKQKIGLNSKTAEWHSIT